MDNIILYGIDYYKKSVFKGSYKGMCFRIAKGGDEDNMALTVTAWRGPYILEKTEEEPLTRDFPFTQEGLDEAEQWLTETQKILGK